MHIRQIDRPPLLLDALHVPCACGRPLVGCEYEIVSGDTPRSGTVFVSGVCLVCGRQQAIFAPVPSEAPDIYAARVTAEVAGLIEQVLALRREASDLQAA